MSDATELLIGEGISPRPRSAFTPASVEVPSIDGIDETSSRVYGCTGSSNSAVVSPSSQIRPRYITATRSLMLRTTPRSWAMNTSVSP